MSDKIVGHKTFSDGNGGFRHEPLRQSEADALIRQVEEAKARRDELMPSEESAISMFFDAWLRLKDFGWKEAMYCPKDGRVFEVIEAGSTGKFRCTYQGEWPTGSYEVYDENDIYSSRPTLYRELPPNDGIKPRREAASA